MIFKAHNGINNCSDGVSTAPQSLAVRKLLPGRTDSLETFQSIKIWLNECLTNHPRCQEVAAFRTLRPPKRILDLRGASIRLCEDFKLQDYACLSHCWGSSTSMVKTTTSNLESFKANVPSDALPKTFLEAIEICRRLDIHFLWIDSLCIIQDSEEDWKEQAAKMADIYENAVFTIAATWAEDSSKGCFSYTDPKFMAKEVDNHDGVYIRHRLPKLPIRWKTEEEKAVREEFPLLVRGWVFQEQYLSPRVLYFTAQEVIWRCHTFQKSENGEVKESGPNSWFDTTLLPRNLWHAIVEAYSSLQLSFERDRFPALAALAERKCNERKDNRFLAGLWEKTLLYDLVWSVAFWSQRSVRSRSSGIYFPSWSWASVKHSVAWTKTHRSRSPLRSVKVLGIQYDTRGRRLTDDLIYASITLQAPLLRLQHKWGFRWEIETQDLQKSDGTILDLLETRKCTLDVEAYERISMGFFLPLHHLDNNKERLYIEGLLLRRTDDSTYERLGYLLMEHDIQTHAFELKEATSSKDIWRQTIAVLESLPVSPITLV